MKQGPFCYQKIILCAPYKKAHGTGIAQSEQRLGNGLDNRGMVIRFSAGIKVFLFVHIIQVGTTPPLATYIMDTGSAFQEGRTAGA